MAILREVPGLECQIIVNGKPLQEYDDEDEESKPKTATKYIEATSGAEFGVRYTFKHSFKQKHSVNAHVKIDGEFVQGLVHDEKKQLMRNISHVIDTTTSKEGSTYLERKFCFSQIDTNDSDIRAVGEDLKKKLKHIGTISVSFYWVNVHGPSKHNSSRRDIATVGTIPEKALKGSAVSHQASFGQAKVVAAFRTVNVSRLDSTPFAQYTFKYRSRSALQSLLVIPRSATPVPLEERDVDELRPEEMRELLRRQRERDAAARAIKREGIKRERSPERSATAEGSNYGDEVSFVSAKRIKLPPAAVNDQGVETYDLT